jgi:hypothetical protein
METIIIHAEPNKTNALMIFLKAFDISFEIKKNKEDSYKSDFVKTMDKSILQAQQGKLTTISLDEVWK